MDKEKFLKLTHVADKETLILLMEDFFDCAIKTTKQAKRLQGIFGNPKDTKKFKFGVGLLEATKKDLSNNLKGDKITFYFDSNKKAEIAAIMTPIEEIQEIFNAYNEKTISRTELIFEIANILNIQQKNS